MTAAPHELPSLGTRITVLAPATSDAKANRYHRPRQPGSLDTRCNQTRHDCQAMTEVAAEQAGLKPCANCFRARAKKDHKTVIVRLLCSPDTNGDSSVEVEFDVHVLAAKDSIIELARKKEGINPKQFQKGEIVGVEYYE